MNEDVDFNDKGYVAVIGAENSFQLWVDYGTGLSKKKFIYDSIVASQFVHSRNQVKIIFGICFHTADYSDLDEIKNILKPYLLVGNILNCNQEDSINYLLKSLEQIKKRALYFFSDLSDPLPLLELEELKSFIKKNAEIKKKALFKISFEIEQLAIKNMPKIREVVDYYYNGNSGGIFSYISNLFRGGEMFKKGGELRDLMYYQTLPSSKYGFNQTHICSLIYGFQDVDGIYLWALYRYLSYNSFDYVDEALKVGFAKRYGISEVMRSVHRRHNFEYVIEYISPLFDRYDAYTKKTTKANFQD